MPTASARGSLERARSNDAPVGGVGLAMPEAHGWDRRPITRVTRTSRNRSFVGRSGLVSPIDLMRPACERAAGTGRIA